LADWLEFYAKVTELNVWTSSTVTLAEKDASGAWAVNLTRILPDGTETTRVLRPAHVVFALGFGAGAWNVPTFPKQVLFSPCFLQPQVDGADSLLLQEEFEGEAIHSLAYTAAKNYIGKKVVVVGAATAGHDVAFDLANHGVRQ